MFLPVAFICGQARAKLPACSIPPRRRPCVRSPSLARAGVSPRLLGTNGTTLPALPFLQCKLSGVGASFGCVLCHGRGRILACRLFNGDGMPILKPFGKVRNARAFFQRALSRKATEFGASPAISESFWPRQQESCVLPRSKAPIGPPWAIG